MSTHAVLGVTMPDGSVTGCYIHQDGQSLFSRVSSYLSAGHTTTDLALKIVRAQDVGGIRSFYSPPFHAGGPTETEYLTDDEAYIINEENWAQDHFGTSYRVIVDFNTAKVTTEN